MGLFDEGTAKQTTQPGDLAPADVASRLFAIKLMLARLAQTGGAPQTFGDYISRGPQRLPSGTISDASGGLLAALQQPGAFRRGPQVTTGKPASPSTFSDIAGPLITLALLSRMMGQDGISGSVGSGASGLASILGRAGVPGFFNSQPGVNLPAGTVPLTDAAGVLQSDPAGTFGPGIDQILSMALAPQTDPTYGISLDSGSGSLF